MSSPFVVERLRDPRAKSRPLDSMTPPLDSPLAGQSLSNEVLPPDTSADVRVNFGDDVAEEITT
jgi:hypothetical protein